jgi:hypothetical protein
VPRQNALNDENVVVIGDADEATAESPEHA